MGTICRYYDEGLGTSVSRRYLKNLDDKIRELKHEIAKYENKIQRKNLAHSSTSSQQETHELSEASVSSGCFIEANRDSYYFGPGSVISMVHSVSKVLNLNSETNILSSIDNYTSFPQIKVPFDFSIIGNDQSRLLIENYLSNIYPVFPLLPESFFHFEVMIRNYPSYEQLFVLLIFLISAAHLMRKRVDFAYIKIMLQQKVAELMKEKLRDSDGDTLLALVYYAIYEMLDPESGSPVWKTLSLACGLAEKLRFSNTGNEGPIPGRVCKQVPRVRLLKVLYELETSVSLCLGRPPSIYFSRNQIARLEIDDGNNRMIFVELTNRIDLFKEIYGKISGCPVCWAETLIEQQLETKSKSTQWLTACSLLTHSCSQCERSSFYLNVLQSCIEVIKNASHKFQKFAPLCFWIEISNVTLSLLSLMVIAKLHHEVLKDPPFQGKIIDAISTGKQLLVRYSTFWPSSQALLSFTEFALESMSVC
ncbi:hypothetical protein KL930_004196 [Ogataea haglerorum]|uniref:uncharacterized protein n=1 Tax=Ogataea haglerorum TaxID=1937702 RepID=UPI001C8A328B|nr:uncharacterized protein KL911_001539 [Ogataea haglerorum]KAG7712117.1 hypothetical protein KL914_000759 [Ogataea haglerorum]KAG7722938.1 hypothetical protein KL913_000758 [Ogataea haglerorum]KAG7722963.1 hypothetical protein KL949_000013 [Ogataea haglerorum]KAG7742395.1 hypothetical protein KL923_000010 [Ogataea haglerorum]KAG7744979.1 hypothetical protein KL932_000009 [Ogataea haglerorum]